MQTTQRARYAERIERAIALLERRARAGEPPALADLAAAAALSDYHFHRIFRVMTGETVGAAVTRVRLGGSLPVLDKGVTAAAGHSGYATAQAYARALKAAAGTTATNLRDDRNRRDEVAAAFAQPAISTSEPAPPLTITITSFAPLRLAALRNVGDYTELNGAYTRLYELLMEQIAPEEITGIYGIPHDDPREVAGKDCRYDCAFATASPLAPISGITTIDLPGGLALFMSHAGDYDLIEASADALYAEAVAADIPVSAAPLLIHALDDPDEVAAADLRATVYLPLQA
ncbi:MULTISPECIES: AraC family transcriptional regulator [Sphingomonas]|uniref:GyrI-like domain-containing protein n=1 Tax=Sphingomonas lycopersici TaxID=2951807 RepID=A0AA41Z8E6_9SPHN|nr:MULTISPECIES: GyrI-like domain-containing protein [Sphingomonas]MCW6532030.1 GyrI-like domain-containing protein [Sphingomonas lycopersici]MCW6535890.1 GyrI-like domain-containing protein [Sphingomonas lycopersici]